MAVIYKGKKAVYQDFRAAELGHPSQQKTIADRCAWWRFIESTVRAICKRQLQQWLFLRA